MSMALKSKVTQSIKSVSYWQGHWLSCPGPSLWKESVSTDYNLTRSYVSQKVFSSSMNPSQNPGFIQAAKEFFEKFKDCANVILGKESTANKQWTRENVSILKENHSYCCIFSEGIINNQSIIPEGVPEQIYLNLKTPAS